MLVKPLAMNRHPLEEITISVRLSGALCVGLCLLFFLIQSFRKLRSWCVSWYAECKQGPNRQGQEGLILSAASLGLLHSWRSPPSAWQVCDPPCSGAGAELVCHFVVRKLFFISLEGDPGPGPRSLPADLQPAVPPSFSELPPCAWTWFFCECLGLCGWQAPWARPLVEVLPILLGTVQSEQ